MGNRVNVSNSGGLLNRSTVGKASPGGSKDVQASQFNKAHSGGKASKSKLQEKRAVQGNADDSETVYSTVTVSRAAPKKAQAASQKSSPVVGKELIYSELEFTNGSPKGNADDSETVYSTVTVSPAAPKKTQAASQKSSPVGVKELIYSELEFTNGPPKVKDDDSETVYSTVTVSPAAPKKAQAASQKSSPVVVKELIYSEVEFTRGQPPKIKAQTASQKAKQPQAKQPQAKPRPVKLPSASGTSVVERAKLFSQSGLSMKMPSAGVASPPPAIPARSQTPPIPAARSQTPPVPERRPVLPSEKPQVKNTRWSDVKAEISKPPGSVRPVAKKTGPVVAKKPVIATKPSKELSSQAAASEKKVGVSREKAVYDEDIFGDLEDLAINPDRLAEEIAAEQPPSQEAVPAEQPSSQKAVPGKEDPYATLEEVMGEEPVEDLEEDIYATADDLHGATGGRQATKPEDLEEDMYATTDDLQRGTRGGEVQVPAEEGFEKNDDIYSDLMVSDHITEDRAKKKEELKNEKIKNEKEAIRKQEPPSVEVMKCVGFQGKPENYKSSSPKLKKSDVNKVIISYFKGEDIGMDGKILLNTLKPSDLIKHFKKCTGLVDSSDSDSGSVNSDSGSVKSAPKIKYLYSWANVGKMLFATDANGERTLSDKLQRDIVEHVVNNVNKNPNRFDIFKGDFVKNDRNLGIETMELLNQRKT